MTRYSKTGNWLDKHQGVEVTRNNLSEFIDKLSGKGWQEGLKRWEIDVKLQTTFDFLYDELDIRSRWDDEKGETYYIYQIIYANYAHPMASKGNRNKSK